MANIKWGPKMRTIRLQDTYIDKNPDVGMAHGKSSLANFLVGSPSDSAVDVGDDNDFVQYQKRTSPKTNLRKMQRRCETHKIKSFNSPKVVSKPDPGFDEQRFFWLANPNPFPPVEGGIIPEDPLQPHSGFSQRILIFGMKAHGKSVLGNYLFGNSPIAWPYGNPGSYFETRGGKRNMTGLLGRSKLDLTMIRVVEMPAPDIQGSKYSFHKRNEIKAFFMDNEDFFHIFCWVKNASEPRYTRADANMLKIIQEVYGKGFYKNLVILMAGYNFSKEAQEQRESWDNFRNRKTTLLKSMFPERLHSQLPNIPITGLDPMCDIFDQQAYFSFLVERNSMSLAFNHFAKTAVIRMDRALKVLTFPTE
ncbi:unnamed protein product [Notodromas monacha]|uniref:AIG1-type G domain-containing protein n=1 Tax=Notodromas monacha TaxID=399045 RepID=A0A7R9BRU5_9CRUS|nr:unnamed protein product [Notodromas monacha]CAG0919144.1 unnamed protein product [Notodromas monacha]